MASMSAHIIATRQAPETRLFLPSVIVFTWSMIQVNVKVYRQVFHVSDHSQNPLGRKGGVASEGDEKYTKRQEVD